MFDLLKNKKIMVVVAHPDDELLGLGASINRLVTESTAAIHVAILGEGLTSRDDVRKVEKWQGELQTHHSNIEEAKKLLGYQTLSVYNLPDNRFDSVDLLDIIKIVEKEKNEFKPEFILTHHSGDLNIDHQRTFQSVITATRPMKDETVKGIWTFETPSGTEWQASTDPRVFNPNCYMKVSKENVQAKIKAMECYEFERREFPHPRSNEALELKAKSRGLEVGLEYAEAFQLVRFVN